jgi:hypothetical protein
MACCNTSTDRICSICQASVRVSAANAAEGLGINTITVTIALATTTRQSMGRSRHFPLSNDGSLTAVGRRYRRPVGGITGSAGFIKGVVGHEPGVALVKRGIAEHRR